MLKFRTITAILSIFIFFSCTVDDTARNDDNNNDYDNTGQIEADELQDEGSETDIIIDIENDEDVFLDTDTVSDTDSSVETCENGEGIYTVTGTDSFGNYTGTVQVYDGKFIRIVTYSDLSG